MIIDTHCHYNLSPLHEDWQTHWQNAQEKGVVSSIVVGTSAETSHKAMELAASTAELYASIGIHPNECSKSPNNFEDQLSKLETLTGSEKILAIGECGLDYFRLSTDQETEKIKNLQKNVLKSHIVLAQKTKLPLIIHLRDKTEEAYWDFLSIFKETATNDQAFILHCVSGPLDFIAECLNLGAYIGVAGNVTYNNSDHIRSIVATTPKNRILLETDAPFLPPLPHRGKTCEPWMIQLTEEYVREFLSLESAQLVENTVQLFPLLKTHV